MRRGVDPRSCRSQWAWENSPSFQPASSISVFRLLQSYQSGSIERWMGELCNGSRYLLMRSCEQFGEQHAEVDDLR